MPPDSPYDAAELAAGAQGVVRRRRELAAAGPAFTPTLVPSPTSHLGNGIPAAGQRTGTLSGPGELGGVHLLGRVAFVTR
jgi:hypothetical protein